MPPADDVLSDDVLSAWGFSGARVEPVAIGLINRTYRVETPGGRFILQRLHPIFGGAVNLDIEAITARLAERGLETPRLIRTLTGAPFLEEDGVVHRVLTLVEGETIEKLRDPTRARSAAGLVARFHTALLDFEHTFHFERPGAHDTPKHLRTLRDAVEAHRAHPNLDAIGPIADRILAHADTLPAIPALPPRIIHGDLKISNLLFDGPRAVALVDLDTMARSTLAIELGDALRSWCNPAGEEAMATVDEAIFEAAMAGYAEATGPEFPTTDERANIVSGFETIALELSARFCADALNESYFGWDSARFPSRSEHNRVRAASQLSLAEAVAARRKTLCDVVEAAFAAR